jgi:hypothetical protein
MDAGGTEAGHQGALPCEEVCDTTTKGDWQPCAYRNYRWQMDQEVGHLGALFGGPEEDEVRVKGQRQAKMWMVKAHESVKRAREHIVCICARCPDSTWCGTASMMGRPRRADCAPSRLRPLSSGPIMCGKAGPGA